MRLVSALGWLARTARSSGSMAAGVECPREPNHARRLRTREPGTTLSPDVSGVFFVSVIDASYSGRHTEACRRCRWPCGVASFRITTPHEKQPRPPVEQQTCDELPPQKMTIESTSRP